MVSRRVLLLVILPAVLLACGLGLYLALRPEPDEGLVTAVVTVGDVEQTVLATGKLRPKELVSVGAQVSGQVQRLHVSLGQSVRAGDLIAEIEARPQRLALQAAEAAVGALQAQQAARQAVLSQAELAFRRQQTLLAADATARADVEAARATRDSARNEVKALAAQIAQARTQAETARINLGYTRIVAPMSGVVVAIVTKQGQTVNAFESAPTIVMLAKLDVMTVRAEISEADVEKVRPGKTVSFTTLGAPERRHKALIERIEPAPESIASEGADRAAVSAAGQGTSSAIYYIALFDVPNPDGRLRPSMTAQISVLIDRARRTVVIPSAALGARDAYGRYAVRVVDPSGRIETRRIRTGISDESRVAVRAGLRPGEKLVIAQAPAAAKSSETGIGL